MNKVIPIKLLSHIKQDVTQLAYLWLITRTDGVVFGFTSHDQDLTIDGQLYLARTGFDASHVSTTADFAVDSMQVGGMLISDLITDADLKNRLWDYADVKLARCQWSDPSAGIEKIRRGKLGEVRTTKYGFSVELLGLMQSLQPAIGGVYVAECDADLGDARCKVNIAAFTVTGTVTASDGSGHSFSDSSRAEVNERFRGGKLTFTSGANAGLAMEVKSFSNVGGVFELQEVMQGLISVGDTYSVYAGCNKVRDGDCLNTFSNTLNHRGFPVKPTEDRIISGK